MTVTFWQNVSTSTSDYTAVNTISYHQSTDGHSHFKIQDRKHKVNVSKDGDDADSRFRSHDCGGTKAIRAFIKADKQYGQTCLMATSSEG